MGRGKKGMGANRWMVYTETHRENKSPRVDLHTHMVKRALYTICTYMQ